MCIITSCFVIVFFFFFNDTATTEIYTLSLHDALPICALLRRPCRTIWRKDLRSWRRSEEHTSELQSHHDLVCRLLLEKKKTKHIHHIRKHHNKMIVHLSDIKAHA